MTTATVLAPARYTARTPGYWAQQELETQESLDIVDLTKQCSGLFSTISKKQHGQQSLDHLGKLTTQFQQWTIQESLETIHTNSQNAASLEILLRNDSMKEFYNMTSQELHLLWSQLLKLETCNERQLKRKRRHYRPLRPVSKRGHTITSAKSDPGTFKDIEALDIVRDFLDVSTDHSECNSISSANSSVNFDNEYDKIDRTFERLKQVTQLCRSVAAEAKHPQTSRYLDGKNDKHLRQIFPRASSWIGDNFPSIPQNLRERAAALMSKKVWELVVAKHNLKVEHSFPNAAVPPRSRTLDLEVKASASSIKSLRRFSTAPNEPTILSSLYPAHAHVDEPNDFEEPDRIVTDQDVENFDTRRRTYEIPARPQYKFLMCTASFCDDDPVVFDSAQDWELHLRTRHPTSRTWTCTAIAHGADLRDLYSVFEFKEHMNLEHSGSFDESELSELADACRNPWRCVFSSACIQNNMADEEGWDETKLDHLHQHLEKINTACWDMVSEYENMLVPQEDTMMKMWENSDVAGTGDTTNNAWMGQVDYLSIKH